MLSVDTDQLRQHADATAGLIDELDTLHRHTQGAGPGASFTTIPGLVELGIYHRECLSGPEGSALHAISYLNRHVTFVVDALRADADVIDAGDDDNARALEGMPIDDVTVVLPTLPELGFAPLPHPGAVGNDPAGIPDLTTFTEAVETTNLDEVYRSVWLWSELARVAESVGIRFTTMSRDLSTTMEGQSTEQASKTLEMLASIAQAIALAAQIMQLCVEFIAVIVDILRAVLGVLGPGLGLLDAAARALVERSFLDALPGQLGVLLRHAVPPLLSLISGQLRGGADALSWIAQRFAAGAPQLQWPADVEKTMCLCGQGSSPLADMLDPQEKAVSAADASTQAAAVPGAAAGVSAAAGIGASQPVVAAAPSILGSGVSIAQAHNAALPAGIGVGSPATRGVAAGPMMAPLAGRAAATPRTKRSPDQGPGLRC
ncbi:hypothetical protein [Corynebacterium cystitidis]|uniref:hypothetical protein n=1 Tax=Corynebacterium cystitidis TaxID=35757 RepID=UPI00211EB275|nr:hypothetical protein [Corynebacterium cystitidis]